MSRPTSVRPRECAAGGAPREVRWFPFSRACAGEHRSAMNDMALIAVLGALVIALPAFFIFGRRSGIGIGQRGELERQRAAKSSAEEIAKRLVDDAEREAETLRKTAVLAGKEELIQLRETAEQELRQRRTTVESEERRVGERESALERRSEAVEQRDRDLGRRASDFGRREKLVQGREEGLEKLLA